MLLIGKIHDITFGFHQYYLLFVHSQTFGILIYQQKYKTFCLFSIGVIDNF